MMGSEYLNFTVIKRGPDAPHRCQAPANIRDYTTGTIIQCDVCDKQHKLVDKLWAGRVWRRVRP